MPSSLLGIQLQILTKVDEGEPDLPSLIHDIDPSILFRTHSLSGKS